MNLSPHFTVEEMCYASATANRLAIPNVPDGHVLLNLKRLCGELEVVRTLLGGVPLKIHSGYRSPALNKAVGGAANSYHMDGLAADFDPPAGMTHDEAQHKIAAGAVDFDLILEEKAKDGAHWLHFQVSRPGVKGRRLVRDAELAAQGGAITRTTAG